MTEHEMVAWHHSLDGHGFEQAPRVGDGQGGLVCCSPWGHKESDTTEWLKWTELNPCLCINSLPRLVCLCSVVSDSAITWTVACRAPLSKGFCCQEYWSGLPFPRLVFVWICVLELREGHGGWRCVPYKKPGTKGSPCPEVPQDPDQFHAEEKMLITVQLYGQMWIHSSKKGNVK